MCCVSIKLYLKVRNYISNFSISVIKHHDQVNLGKEGFIWADTSRRVEPLVAEQTKVWKAKVTS